MPELLDQLSGILKGVAGLPLEIAIFGSIFLVAFVLINFVAVYAGLCTYAERKIAGHIQARVGPFVIGPHGILIWLADAIKLILKEDIIPAKADALLFKAAPYVVFAGSFACWVALPLWPGFAGANLSVGVLYIVALGSSVVLGVLMSGWASGNKWALFGAMRSAAQIVSYEIPTGLTILAVLLMVGSLNMQEIAAGQASGTPFNLFGGEPHYWGAGSWFIFRYVPFSLIACLVLYICALAETNRVPFDIPEAESELVAGYHTEYTGFRFSIFFLSEYANMFVTSAIVVTLFLGGWLPPFPKMFDHHVYDIKEGSTVSVPLSPNEADAPFGKIAHRADVVEAHLRFNGTTVHTYHAGLADGSAELVFPALDARGGVSHDSGYRVQVEGGQATVEQGKFIPGIWLAAKMKAPPLQYVEGLTWFMLKTVFLVFFMMWLRWTIPRYRVDQLMEVCWKKLTPLAFINLFFIGALELLGRRIG
jgi:NADH-quinone oxidoreductase subunit H